MNRRWISSLQTLAKIDKMSTSPFPPRIFPIVVMGATGVGKSKLAIEIAEKFDGEVINADSMQIYKGLDVVTNKVTAEERQLVRHHLMDFVDPAMDVHTVVDFRNEALPVIDEMLERGKTPVICGGTMYYIEALLWDVLIPSGGIPHPNNHAQEVLDNEDVQAMREKEERVEEEKGDREEDVGESLEQKTENNFNGRKKPSKKEIDALDALELYDKLKACDPETASRLHPNDKRKVMRALQIFQHRGVKMSQCLEEQHKESSSNLRGPLRYPETVMFWVESEASVLNRRLDDRVDKMVEAGMLEEMLQFHARFNEDRVKKKEIGADYTGGIFQSIGFKEFHKFLTMSSEGRESVLGQKAFKEGLDLLKLHTRQYTKSQRKWINNRFLKKTNPDEPIPPIFKVDSTDVSIWNGNVRDKVFRLLEHLRGQPTFESSIDANTATIARDKINADETAAAAATTAAEAVSKEGLLRPETVILRRKEDETCECAICGKFFTSQEQLNIHHLSKQHRKQLANLKEARQELSRTLGLAEAKKRDDEAELSDERKDAKEIECLPCKRKFDSEEKYAGHVVSKKHKKKSVVCDADVNDELVAQGLHMDSGSLAPH